MRLVAPPLSDVFIRTVRPRALFNASIPKSAAAGAMSLLVEARAKEEVSRSPWQSYDLQSSVMVCSLAWPSCLASAEAIDLESLPIT